MNKYTYIFIILFAISIKPTIAQRAATFFIQDSAGNLYPQTAYDSLSKVKSIILRPYKTNGIIEGYLITNAPVNTIPFVPKKKKYNIMEVFTIDNKVLQIGGKMPKYIITDLDGNNYNSDSLKGKVVVMNFWFKSCGPCKHEIPYLNGLVDYYSSNEEVKFIALGLDDSIACGIFLQRINYNYHIVPDARPLSQKWDIYAFPTHIIINKQGTIVLYTEGYASGIEYYLDEGIKEGLRGKE
ncbi:MAG: TlpA disulfide reductase family protein [Bacteroidota bacterium]|nr:TlpA disulfide reductase family protein [Bacteroidota bacterium]